MTDTTTQALRAARLALALHHNCLITDRPDLPRSADSSWTTDFSDELTLIGAAIELRTASLCAHGSSVQQKALITSPATRLVEPERNRSPERDLL